MPRVFTNALRRAGRRESVGIGATPERLVDRSTSSRSRPLRAPAIAPVPDPTVVPVSCDEAAPTGLGPARGAVPQRRRRGSGGPVA